MNAGYLYGYLIDFAVLSAKYTSSKITNYICLNHIFFFKSQLRLFLLSEFCTELGFQRHC